MTDRELLERAALVAGISGRYRDDWDAIERSDYRDSFGRGEQWRPHRDDGDAFRLMARLNLNLGFDAVDSGVEVAVMAVWDGGPDTVCEVFDGPDAAPSMRRAIVRAAAAMGVDDG